MLNDRKIPHIGYARKKPQLLQRHMHDLEKHNFTTPRDRVGSSMSCKERGLRSSLPEGSHVSSRVGIDGFVPKFAVMYHYSPGHRAGGLWGVSKYLNLPM